MKVHNIMPSGHLYHVTDVFPQNLIELIYSIPWYDLEYQRLVIGSGKRRLISNHYKQLVEIHDYAQANIVPSVEELCGVKFTETHHFNISWWLDEPGFRPKIHTDGELPSAMQLYWLPQHRTDLGTAFYQKNDKKHVIHEFASQPNSGYLMFNSHCVDGKKIDLWHDMVKGVPANTLRLCSYLWFGPYIKL